MGWRTTTTIPNPSPSPPPPPLLFPPHQAQRAHRGHVYARRGQRRRGCRRPRGLACHHLVLHPPTSHRPPSGKGFALVCLREGHQGEEDGEGRGGGHGPSPSSCTHPPGCGRSPRSGQSQGRRALAPVLPRSPRRRPWAQTRRLPSSRGRTRPPGRDGCTHLPRPRAYGDRGGRPPAGTIAPLCGCLCARAGRTPPLFSQGDHRPQPGRGWKTHSSARDRDAPGTPLCLTRPVHHPDLGPGLVLGSSRRRPLLLHPRESFCRRRRPCRPAYGHPARSRHRHAPDSDRDGDQTVVVLSKGIPHNGDVGGGDRKGRV